VRHPPPCRRVLFIHRRLSLPVAGSTSEKSLRPKRLCHTTKAAPTFRVSFFITRAARHRYKPFHHGQAESGSHRCVQSFKHVRTRSHHNHRGHDRVVRKTIRPPACSPNGSMVQALRIFAHGIEPKVKQRQHPPYNGPWSNVIHWVLMTVSLGSSPQGNVTGRACCLSNKEPMQSHCPGSCHSVSPTRIR
jgi:hypothetical protein